MKVEKIIVTNKFEPAYTSGTHPCKGAAPILIKKPKKIIESNAVSEKFSAFCKYKKSKIFETALYDKSGVIVYK